MNSSHEKETTPLFAFYTPSRTKYEASFEHSTPNFDRSSTSQNRQLEQKIRTSQIFTTKLCFQIHFASHIQKDVSFDKSPISNMFSCLKMLEIFPCVCTVNDYPSHTLQLPLLKFYYVSGRTAEESPFVRFQSHPQ